MEILVRRANGNVIVNSREIEILAEEQLKMIPGIKGLGRISLHEKVKGLFKKNYIKPVRVYPIAAETIGIECHIQVARDVNFTTLSKGAQETIKFSVQKHYGVEVGHIDIFVEGVFKR